MSADKDTKKAKPAKDAKAAPAPAKKAKEPKAAAAAAPKQGKPARPAAPARLSLYYKDTVTKALTQKFAYGALKGVPVYKGTADQTIWMSEQVFSLGFLF